MDESLREKVRKTAALMKLCVEDETEAALMADVVLLAERMGQTLTRLPGGVPDGDAPERACPLRPDEPRASLPAETVLALAPKVRDQCISVPRTVRENPEG